jgi:hypothetical protein
VAFDLDCQPLGIGGTPGDGGLLVVAGGEVRLQPRELVRGGPAVADWFAEHLQALRTFVLAAQARQPLAGHRRRRADLEGQLGRVQPLAARQLAGQVGVGDPVADQPRPQLPEARVAVPCGAQQS